MFEIWRKQEEKF